MKLPAASNTTTGGAAIFASSGLSSVRGRWSSQTLSLASIAKLDGSPTLYFGGSLGQALSTSKTGRLLVCAAIPTADRKSTRLNSSHSQISYAVFCLKKKKNKI